MSHHNTVFLNILGNPISDYSSQDLCNALNSTIQQICEWQRIAGISDSSYLNFAISDGHNVIVSRYVTIPEKQPPTLYISSGERFITQGGKFTRS